MTFNKILIANRGEIAVRIINSAKKLGITTASIYSEVDADSMHVELSDESYCIGKLELSDTYLNIKKIIDVAKRANCEAIHPGYGFLAENPEFVKECEKANIVFIGPSSSVIKLMGNKIEARNFIKSIDVPIIDGITGDTKTLLNQSKNIPFPLLIKAAAGGGGKGMRIVHNAQELAPAIEATSREAKSYFGDGTVFIEKYIEEPRHIEIQIIGDNYGNVVHLFERECSIQRRYQKIIEESPSPTIDDAVRKKMGEAAVRIGKETKYNNAGTIEFMVDKNLKFYFLEMNTRIQVEHPVTELVTGIDIVEEQISVAAGNKLRLKQNNIKQNGHAIECRIYAEDPANNFIPSPGNMTLYKEPEGNNIRLDTGIAKKTTIQSYFDPMICKLVVWGKDRGDACNIMTESLQDFIIHGINTNISYLTRLLQHKAFISNKISTKFCDEHTNEIIDEINAEKEKVPGFIPVIAYLLYSFNKQQRVLGVMKESNIWTTIGYWRNSMTIKINLEKKEYPVKLNKIKNNYYEFEISQNKYSSFLKNIEINGKLEFTINDNYYSAYISEDEKGNAFVSYQGKVFHLNRIDLLSSEFLRSEIESATGHNGKNITSPMPGRVIKINVKQGDKVNKGDVLLIVEAMKMENNIASTRDAVIEKVNVSVGDTVDGSASLIVFADKL